MQNCLFSEKTNHNAALSPSCLSLSRRCVIESKCYLMRMLRILKRTEIYKYLRRAVYDGPKFLFGSMHFFLSLQVEEISALFYLFVMYVFYIAFHWHYSSTAPCWSWYMYNHLLVNSLYVLWHSQLRGMSTSDMSIKDYLPFRFDWRADLNILKYCSFDSMWRRSNARALC